MGRVRSLLVSEAKVYTLCLFWVDDSWGYGGEWHCRKEEKKRKHSKEKVLAWGPGEDSTESVTESLQGGSFKSRPWVHQHKTKRLLGAFSNLLCAHYCLKHIIHSISLITTKHCKVEISIPNLLQLKSGKAKLQAQITSYSDHCCSLNDIFQDWG